MHTVQADIALRQHPGQWSIRLWFVSVVIPLLILALILMANYVGGDFKYWLLKSQVGIQESATGALAFAAGVIGLIAYFHRGVRHDRKLRVWLLLFVMAMIYFAGEDLNWGQYYFGWNAPEFFQVHNREQETNLHNMSPWFNQKPRLVVELWLLIAGVLVPLGWRLPQRLTKKVVPNLLWPDMRLVFVSIMALLAMVASSLQHHAIVPGIRWSEVQEIYFAYAWLLYALLLLARIGELRQDRASAHP